MDWVERKGWVAAQEYGAASPRRIGLFLILNSLFFILGLSGFAASAHAAAGTLYAPPNLLGLVAYYPLDSATTNFSNNTTQDLSGYNNTGTLVNMTSANLVTHAQLGQAIAFNGNSYIEDTTNNLGFTSAVTMSAWINTSYNYASLTSDMYGIISRFAAGSYVGYMMGINGGNYTCGTAGKIYFHMAGSYNTDYLCGTIAVNDGKWHDIVVTYDGTTASIYIDGALNASAAIPNGLSSASIPFRVGATYNTTRDFYGTIDDVRVFSRALSASEVTQMYQQGLAGHGAGTRDNSPTSLLTNGLIAYWPLDGNTTNWNTNTTADLSGNGYTLRLNGMSTTSSPALGRFGQGLLVYQPGSREGELDAESPNVPWPKQAITMSIWFSPIGTANNTQGDLLIGGNNYAPYAIGFSRGRSWNSTIINMAISTSTTYYRQTPCSNATPANFVQHHWYLISATFDGANMRLYLNGQNIATCALSGGIGKWGAPSFGLSVGGAGGVYSVPGIIDDVRIYNRALSPTEIMQLYDAGAVGTTIDQAPTDYLSNGLVGYWPFDGNEMNWKTDQALDASGNGNNGTLINMSTTTSPVQGVIGQALKFNGSSQYVQVGSLGFAGNGTISLWAKSSSVSGFASWVNGESSGSSNTALEFGSNGSSIYIAAGTYIGGGSYTQTTDGKWHFYTLVSNGSTASLYIDGTVNASVSHTFSSVPSLWIGRGPGTGYFNGSIDDVRIYNRALSAAEVQQLYNLGR